MKNVYYINLEAFSLEKFKKGLQSRELLPGRRILLEDIENRFQILSDMGIENLDQLLTFLKTKKKVEQATKETSIEEGYLTILRREAGSFLPTLLNLDKIIEPEHCEAITLLVNKNITNSKKLFEAAFLINPRKDLAKETGINYTDLTRWVQYCDLLRVNGVGPMFARMIYDAGITHIRKFKTVDTNQMLQNVKKVNEVKQYTTVGLRKEDFQYCLDYVNELDDVLEID
jgi:hypothetical protein